MSFKAIVFDIGGTLMEYKEMPLSWLNYKPSGNYSARHSDTKEALINTNNQ